MLMNLIYRCKHLKLEDGAFVKRPLIPVTLIGKSERLNFTAVLDSGSDYILLPLEVAESLGLNFDKTDVNWKVVNNPENYGDTWKTALKVAKGVLAGKYDILITIRTRSMGKGYRNTIRKISALPNVTSLKTMAILKEWSS